MTAKQASPKGLAWFQDNRFGMFIHWGLYSIIGRQEWVMHIERIPVPEYEKLVPQFNPVKYNADEWVSIAADAGQKYMVITSRHHDGFSMYDTKLSDYKVTNTPFKRDPIAELANAIAKRSDMKLAFYSSLLDWHHPAYRFRKESGLAWSDYIAFLHGQVREICTNYGEIASIWFDGDWPKAAINEGNAYFEAGGSFEYDKLYDMIHTLQPDAVIHNNRHAQPLPGEDVQGFEQDLPGENTVGFNETQMFDMPIEVCMTIGANWGYHVDDENFKSTRQLIRYLVRAAGSGGNYLLNVGPTALGEILPIQVQRLHEMGQWLKTNGESIYGTRKGAFMTGRTRPALTENAGAFEPSGEAVSTRRGDTHYIHVLEYISDVVEVKNVTGGVNAAALKATLLDGSPVKMKSSGDIVSLTIPAEQRDPLDTVVKLAVD